MTPQAFWDSWNRSYALACSSFDVVCTRPMTPNIPTLLMLWKSLQLRSPDVWTEPRRYYQRLLWLRCPACSDGHCVQRCQTIYAWRVQGSVTTPGGSKRFGSFAGRFALASHTPNGHKETLDNYDLLSPEQLRTGARRMRNELDNLYKAGSAFYPTCFSLVPPALAASCASAQQPSK